MSLETIWCDLKTCELNHDCGWGNGHCLDPINADKCPYYKLLYSESQRDQDKEPSPCEFCKHNDIADDMVCLKCPAERRRV